MRSAPTTVMWIGADEHPPAPRSLCGREVLLLAVGSQRIELADAVAACRERAVDVAVIVGRNRTLAMQLAGALHAIAAVVVVEADPSSDGGEAFLEAGADVVLAQYDEVSLTRAVLAARRAARSRAALQALSAALGVGAWVIDGAGGSLFESAAAPSLGLGTLPTAIVLPRPDGTAADLSAVATLATAEGAASEALLLTDAQCEERLVQRAVRVVETASGRVSVALHEDITKQRDLERRLVLAQKNETVSQLSRGVVHDLNNAFCIIQSFADLLRESTPKGDARIADIDEIARATIRAATMTRSLSGFQKRGSGHVETVNVAEQLRRLEPLARRLLGERSELAIAADGAATVLCDPALFEQAVLDAVSIVRPAGEGGLVTVTLDEEPSAIVLKVMGALEGSSGARLHALSEVMVFAGGEARAGKSGIELRLPRSNRLLGGAKPPRAQALTPETILIVEDERPVRVAMSRVLGSLGYRVLEARRSADARSFALGGSIDLIVSDVVLPDGNGIALLAELRTTTPHARGLLVTGYSEAELGSQMAGLPLLMKPFTTLELARKVRQALDSTS